MLALSSRSRALLLAPLGLLLLPGTARASWIESGDVDLVVLQADTGYTVQEHLEAGDVNVEDEMVQVSVGSDTPGEVTVVEEGSGLDRKVLGYWDVYEGTGNIQSTIGILNRANVGDRAGAGTIGVLDLLNSDLELGVIRVLNGTAILTASTVAGVEVFDGSSLYATFSRLEGLTTRGGSYTSIQGSIVSSALPCQLRGTVLIEDSTLRCREINVANLSGGGPATVDIRRAFGSGVIVETTEEFVVNGGSVDIVGAIATTGSIAVGSVDSDLDITASTWTNAGGIAIEPSATVGPVEMAIGAGSDFHELATVRVAGHPAWQHLTVNGGGTELDVAGDLRIGEDLDFQGNPLDFTGNVTVSNGAVVSVDGTLAVRPQGVLTIESGATVYAASVANAGTITENGGTLVLPEPAGAIAGAAALAVLARRARKVARP